MTSRRGFTVVEVVVAAALIAPVLALAWSLATGGLRALSGGAARSGALRGAVSLREHLARDLARVPPGTRARVVAGRLVVPAQGGAAVYEQAGGEVWRTGADGVRTRIGGLMRGAFAPSVDASGAVSVAVRPLEEAGDRPTAGPEYAEAFGSRIRSRWSPFFRPVVTPAPWQ